MTIELFYSPGACSLVPHVALEETGADYEAVRVVLADGAHRTADYLAINPHSRVPTLRVDGRVITENVAILNYLADRFGAEGSVPRGDPLEAARCNELLGWFASSVHISFAAIWRGSRFTDDEALWPALEAGGCAALEQQFAEIEALCGENWLVGDRFSAADGYALTFFRWGRRICFDMTRYPRWAALVGRALARPHVARVLADEGLGADQFLVE